MKKILKRVGILLLLSAAVFALSGCGALDEMRAHQLFPEEDGSFYKDGVHYVELEANAYFSPANEFAETYYLTKPDVPVLLSPQFNIGWLNFTEDGRFCYDAYDATWFCREDIFEEMQAKNREPFVPDTLFYNYYSYDQNGEWVDTIYRLSQEEVAAIAEALKGEPLQLGDGLYIGSDWEFGLTEATNDLLFQHSGPSISKAGNSFYLSVYSSGDGRATTYQVPEELNPIFDKISAAYLSEFYFDYALTEEYYF